MIAEAPSTTKTGHASRTTEGTLAIEARGLTKTFGDFHAVKDVSFAIPTGQLVAFLGPNGAGKSTTMRMLTGYLSPSAGVARVAGFDMAEDRVSAAEVIGYLPENGPLYAEMTPRSLLRFMGSVRGMDAGTLAARVEAVVAQCRLEQVFTRTISKLSKGYRQRVGMAAALLHDPRVLILDEPTAGLDPNQVDHVRALLKDLARTRAVLLSTHVLSEVRALADRVLLISHGRLVHDGPAGSLGKDEREMEQRFGALTR
ncbi:MAG: ABC transporter ATP-binding protein [Phycisphaerales bacterium]